MLDSSSSLAQRRNLGTHLLPSRLVRVAPWDSSDNHQVEESSNQEVSPKLPTYNFRPFKPGQQIFFSACIDRDESGDFDPNAKPETKKVLLINKRKKSASDPESGLEPGAKKPRNPVTLQAGRRNGYSFPLRFEIRKDILQTEPGKALAAKLKSTTDNWPFSEKSDPGDEPNLTDLNRTFIQPSRLRQREENQETKSSDTSFCEEVTIGHLAARGCKACLQIGIACNLIAGGRYPCSHCREEREECELIIEPLQKRACESCTRRKIICSFRTTADHGGPCLQCKQKSFKCVAGPKNDRLRLDQQRVPKPRVRLAGSSSNCFQCEQVGEVCSLRSKPEHDDCDRCKIFSLDCFFKSSERKGKKTKSKAVSEPEFDSVSNPPVTGQGPSAITRTISTRLTHPIILNYEASNDSTTPCHWCQDLAYGLIGLPEVRVDVIDYQNGDGHVEVEGGRAGQGCEPSKMCWQCTMSRFLTATCSDHDIQPIQEMDPNTFDYDSVPEWLISGHAASAPFEWCSVCLSAAFYCCTANTFGGFGALLGEEGRGCGLMLCEECEERLRSEFTGNLTLMIANLQAHAGGDAQIRADVSLLRVDEQLVMKFGHNKSVA